MMQFCMDYVGFIRRLDELHGKSTMSRNFEWDKWTEAIIEWKPIIKCWTVVYNCPTKFKNYPGYNVWGNKIIRIQLV